MKHSYFTIKAGILLSSLLFACNVKREAAITPSICPSSEFRSTALSYDADVDFVTENAVFTASFNEEVDWILTIKGKISGAVKRFSGRSNAIHETWLGEPDTAAFFGLEQCDISLKLACRDAHYSTMVISGRPTFRNQPSMIFVKDFDFADGKPIWSETSSKLPVNSLITNPSDPSPQGGNYYQLSGASNTPEYYFGQATFPQQVIPWKDPDMVYFNALIKSDGIANSTVSIGVNASAQGVLYRKQLNYQGWKLVSFKLSDIEVVDATKVTDVIISLDSSPERGTSATVKIDFMIFTYGAPFYTETGF